MKVHVTKGAELTHDWHLVDADGIVLGRLASEVANLLRGKHKTNYTPYLDNADHIVVVNAEKVVLSGRKLEQKVYRRHTGYPGGVRERLYGKWLAEHPEDLVRKAVRGMLPKNSLGRALLRHVRIYRGAEHPHTAQMPKPYTVASSRTPRAA